MFRRLALVPLALLSLSLSACDPRICTQLERDFGVAACGEDQQLNTPPSIFQPARNPEFGFALSPPPSPEHQIVMSDYHPEVDETVTLSVNAEDRDGDDLYFEWDLDGDGDLDDRAGYGQRQPSHPDRARAVSEVTFSYPQDRIVTVTVRVSDFPRLPGGEGQTTSTRTFRVHTREQHERDRPPVARLTVRPNPVEKYGVVTLDASGSSDPDGDSLSYFWSTGGFGDFEAGPVITMPAEQFSEPDQSWAVSVHDPYGRGELAYATFSIVTGERPQLELVVEPNPAPVNEPVTFRARWSRDPDRIIEFYDWRPLSSRDSEVTTSDPVYQHTYTTPGRYRVLLGARESGSGRTVELAEAHLDVYQPAGPGPVEPEPGGPGPAEPEPGGPGPAEPEPGGPTARLVVYPNPASTNQTVTFDASDSNAPDSEIVKYEWDLDEVNGYEVEKADGAQKAEPFASRCYPDPGQYTVNLRVTDKEGRTDVDTQTLDVNAAPGVCDVPAASLRRPSIAAKRRSRLGPPRPFSARLTGISTTGGGAALASLGKLDARLSGPGKLTRAERALKRFLAASWRTRLEIALDRPNRSATVRGLALATPKRGGGRACVRLRIVARAGQLPRGTFKVLGGTGSAARLRGTASFRFRAADNEPAVILGTLRATQGRPRGMPRACARVQG